MNERDPELSAEEWAELHRSSRRRVRKVILPNGTVRVILRAQEQPENLVSRRSKRYRQQMAKSKIQDFVGTLQAIEQGDPKAGRSGRESSRGKS
ncbi:MAG: hypothetical protein E6I27_16055 [Chloroflexi bacterium]|nr:MAG: hypothetical protein E6I27_16055 [Chloroflexota bacterium]